MARVGRYTIDRLLARGGMAEVYVARAEGPGGFSKEVVIKRILPHLAQSEAFVEMFFNEARIAAQLNHPNIVQVYDFGEEAGQHYLTMEYVKGETLRTIMRAFERRREGFPVRLALKIITGICEGLHFAHELCDETGTSFHIVHRDVSPDNVLVARSGQPKVLDFGIAKAVSAGGGSPLTDPGAVKGKYAYMSPEQVRSEPLDRRADVYALGIMLYELLCGRRPYRAENDLALLSLILEANPKPLPEVAPVDQALWSIVATAMHADREQRYPDCRALQTVLERYLDAHGGRPASSELEAVVDMASQYRTEHGPGERSAGLRSKPLVPTLLQPEPRTETGPNPINPADGVWIDVSPTDPTMVALARRRRLLRVAMALGALLTVLLVGVWLKRATREAEVVVPPAPVVVAPLPKSPVELRGIERNPEAAAPDTEPLVAKNAQIEPNTQAAQVEQNEQTKQTEPAKPEAVAVPDVKPLPTVKAVVALSAPVVGEGFVTVRTDPWCDVYVDGVKLGTTPLSRMPVSAGRHVLELRNAEAGARRTLPLVVLAGKESKTSVVFEQGTLFFEAPAQTEVSVNGRRVGVTPLDPVTVLEGSVKVRLVNAKLGRDETQVVKVKAGGRQLVRAAEN